MKHKKKNEKSKSSNFPHNSNSLIAISTIPLVELESGDRERPRDPGGISEGNLPRTGIINIDIGDGDPDK